MEKKHQGICKKRALMSIETEQKHYNKIPVNEALRYLALSSKPLFKNTEIIFHALPTTNFDWTGRD